MPLIENGVVKIVGGVSPVGDDIGTGDFLDQFQRPFYVALLTGTGEQSRRISQRVGGGMDFRAQATARTSQALGFRPPFFRRAPAAC